MVDADLNERIRRRAYELWEQEGRPGRRTPQGELVSGAGAERPRGR